MKLVRKHLMKLASKIVGTALTATALCGLGIRAASGATAGDSQGVPTVSQAADSVKSVVTYKLSALVGGLVKVDE